MSEKGKKGEPVRRCLRIIELLVGHVADGMSNKELAQAGRTSAVNVSRDLALLESLGWVKQNEARARWSLTSKPLALFKAFEIAHAEMRARAEELLENMKAAALRHWR